MGSTIRIYISVLLILVPPIGFGIAKMPKEMGLALAAGVFAACFVNIDKIAKFSGFGINAEMRQAIDEAYATTAALKKLATPVLVSAVNILAYGGRYSGVPAQTKERLIKEFDQLAEELSLQDLPELRKARDGFFALHTRDAYRAFLSSLRDLRLPEVTMNTLRALQDRIPEESPTESAIRGALGSEASKLGSEQTECLADYLYYRDNRRLRRGPDTCDEER